MDISLVFLLLNYALRICNVLPKQCFLPNMRYFSSIKTVTQGARACRFKFVQI